MTISGMSSVTHTCCYLSRMWRRPGGRLKAVIDVLEDAGNGWTEQGNRGDDHDGHEQDNQRVLDKPLAPRARKRAVQHGELPILMVWRPATTS